MVCSANGAIWIGLKYSGNIQAPEAEQTQTCDLKWSSASDVARQHVFIYLYNQNVPKITECVYVRGSIEINPQFWTSLFVYSDLRLKTNEQRVYIRSSILI